ncbi:hypothetical protein ES288_A06G021200v1 [Gossypium darwinii]|uniref:Uncharacterized protein n=1 Tax=Gossypium darwinii TaxID=34276 RepID=A0A5D2G2T6_GOSDA|nr:hypothetical protein ES288_A06G021200v1 [Gossypium darwinii]
MWLLLLAALLCSVLFLLIAGDRGVGGGVWATFARRWSRWVAMGQSDGRGMGTALGLARVSALV